MRATLNSQSNGAVINLETASERLHRFMLQVSSGKRLNKPSDDPTAAAAAVGERAELAAVDQYQRTADSVTGRLTVVDTALGGIVDKVSSALSATAAARGSTKTPADREASALQIEAIGRALIADFNVSLNGAYVFAGTASTTRPFDADAAGVVGPYAGSTDMQVDVGRDAAVTVGFDGSAIVQGDADQDIFAVLRDLAAAARAGDADALDAGFTSLQTAFSRVTSAQVRVGVGMNTVDGQVTRLKSSQLSATARLSTLEDANLSEVITGMSQADAAYKAALGAIGAASKVSLMDYLR